MKNLTVSVVIPCYNEEKYIEELLARVYEQKQLVDEIIVVDDCSADRSSEILGRLKEQYKLKVFRHDKNLGKGAAISTGLRETTMDVVIIQDADLEYNPSEYENLLKPIFIGEADVVYGSRFIGGQYHRVLFFWHMIGNRILTLISNMFTNLNMTDMETCYKVFKTEVARKIQIKENRFGFEPEITAKLAKLNLRIYEVGIAYSGRTYSDGKKIGWKDGVRAIYAIVKYNLFR